MGPFRTRHYLPLMGSLSVLGCGGEPAVPPPVMAAESQRVTEEGPETCGQSGSMEPVASNVLMGQIAGLEDLSLDAQEQVIGTLNLVPAPCCACWESSSIAQCLLLQPAGCENLTSLSSRAVRLASVGVSGPELRMALSYGDYWIAPEAEQPEGSRVVAVEMWIDPAHAGFGFAWEQLQDIKASIPADANLQIQLRYISVEGDDSELWSAGALAAAEQGRESIFLGAHAQTVTEGLAPSERLEQVLLAAAPLGLETQQWRESRTAPSIQERLAADRLRARASGVRSSPTWFVEGYRLRGLQSKLSVLRLISLAMDDLEPSSDMNSEL
jgi:hypothetical protein